MKVIKVMNTYGNKVIFPPENVNVIDYIKNDKQFTVGPSFEFYLRYFFKRFCGICLCLTKKPLGGNSCQLAITSKATGKEIYTFEEPFDRLEIVDDFVVRESLIGKNFHAVTKAHERFLRKRIKDVLDIFNDSCVMKVSAPGFRGDGILQRISTELEQKINAKEKLFWSTLRITVNLGTQGEQIGFSNLFPDNSPELALLKALLDWGKYHSLLKDLVDSFEDLLDVDSLNTEWNKKAEDLALLFEKIPYLEELHTEYLGTEAKE